MRPTLLLLVFKSMFILTASVIHAEENALETQRLACFFYDAKNPQDGVGLLNTGLPSVWAKGLSNEDIYVSGVLEDGFFTISRLRGKTRGYFGLRLVANYENSRKLAQYFCKKGIEHAFKNDYPSKELVHLGVRTSLLSLKNYPAIFKQNKKSLEKPIDKIVVFGDSLSDQGNLKRWLRIFPNAPYFAGRFSDHFIWIDYLQRQTGISVQNWAVGGSVSNIFMDLEFNQKPFREKTKRRAQTIIAGNLTDEIQKYKNKSLTKGQLTNADSTLFSLWIGGNDYISLMESPTDADIFLDQPDDQRVGSKLVIRRVIQNLVGNITKLYNAGARNFLVVNMPDLGQLPRILENQTYHLRIYEPKQAKLFNLSKKMSAISESHNTQLKEEIEKLNKSLLNSKIIYADINDGMLQINTNTIKLNDSMLSFNYDFNTEFITNLTNNNQTIAINHPCYTGNEVQTSNDLICNEPKKAVFWDKTHPSSYSHCLIAAYIHTQMAQNNVLNPSTLNEYLKLCRPELVTIK